MIDSDSFYEMLENIQRGIDLKLAMKAFGISKRDLEPWHKKEMIKAKAQATIAMQQVIHEHGAEDWRAMQWIIERNNKERNDEQELQKLLNKQLAKEMAKGLIESNVAGETLGDPRSQEGESGEAEDYSDSEKPRGVLRIPRNQPDSTADGDI
jgi:hypothetical protein